MQNSGLMENKISNPRYIRLTPPNAFDSKWAISYIKIYELPYKSSIW